MTLKQFKSLANRQHEATEPLIESTGKTTYKVLEVFKDTSFLKRIQEEKDRDLLEYYMNLPYMTEVKSIPIEDGGGFTASIPQFGWACCGDGETEEESLKSLDEGKRIMFQNYIEAGIIIPEPEVKDA